MTDVIAPRRQHAEERRQQIVDAAAKVFAEKGYAGASICDIAREVGVTEGLLYHYFPGKEELMDAVWRERSWRANLERILAGAEGTPVLALLRELVQDFLQTMRQNGPMVRLCAAEMQRNEEMAAFYIGRIEENQRLIVDFLSRRQAVGELRADASVEDLGTAAGLLMGSAYSLFLLWGLLADTEWNATVNRFVDRAVDVLWQGIGVAGVME